MSLRLVEGLHYSESGRRVVNTADQEAGNLLHPYIGTEHITLGLLQDASGQPLVEAGVRYEDFYRQLQFISPKGHRAFYVPRALSSRATLILTQQAPDISKRRGSETIEPSDILEGLVTLDQGIALTVLDAWGEKLRTKIPSIITTMRDIEGRLKTTPTP